MQKGIFIQYINYINYLIALHLQKRRIIDLFML